MKVTLVILNILLCYITGINAQSDMKTNDPDFSIFQLTELKERMSASDRPWLSVMDGDNILTGIYALSAGAEDRQSPHDTDEVYYVVSGKGKFMAGEEEVAFKSGSILFVKAGVTHRFFDIEEDMVSVVFFDK